MAIDQGVQELASQGAGVKPVSVRIPVVESAVNKDTPPAKLEPSPLSESFPTYANLPSGVMAMEFAPQSPEGTNPIEVSIPVVVSIL
jgi:hypothetical protein